MRQSHLAVGSRAGHAPLDLGQHIARLDRMNQRHLARHVFHLVGLQRADEVPARLRQTRGLCRGLDFDALVAEFLPVAFAEILLASGQRSHDIRRSHGLADRHQARAGRGPTRAGLGPRDAGAHLAQIGSDVIRAAHRAFPPKAGGG
jgi:hypothetical protein